MSVPTSPVKFIRDSPLIVSCPVIVSPALLTFVFPRLVALVSTLVNRVF
ncbi:hypothetical protein [Bacillus cereus]|nr:hypothetical protein [Bacillus cereus]